MNTAKVLLNRCLQRRFIRYYNIDVGANDGSAASSTVPPPPTKADVPGLSNAVIYPASQPVGPGVDPNKTGAYKVPEYFCYNNMSYFEAEIEMSKFRCPQPSALRK